MKKRTGRVPVGIIGVGRLGEYHLRQIREIPEAALIGIHEIRQDRAAAIGETYGVSVFDSAGELLQNAEAVIVASPTSTHGSIGKRVLTADRHLFVEKPMTATLTEAEELSVLAQERDLVLQVGHVERFNPAFLAVSDEPLRPSYIEACRLAPYQSRGTDVSVILDLMIHDLDIVLSLNNSPIASVAASGSAIVSESLDAAHATLQFENGVVASLTASRVDRETRRIMQFYTTSSYYVLDFLAKGTEYYTPKERLEIDGRLQNGEPITNGSSEQPVLYRYRRTVQEINALKLEVQSFIRSIRTGEPPPVSGLDGMRVLKAARMIEETIELNRIKFRSC